MQIKLVIPLILAKHSFVATTASSRRIDLYVAKIDAVGATRATKMIAVWTIDILTSHLVT